MGTCARATCKTRKFCDMRFGRLYSAHEKTQYSAAAAAAASVQITVGSFAFRRGVEPECGGGIVNLSLVVFRDAAARSRSQKWQEAASQTCGLDVQPTRGPTTLLPMRAISTICRRLSFWKRQTNAYQLEPIGVVRAFAMLRQKRNEHKNTATAQDNSSFCPSFHDT